MRITTQLAAGVIFGMCVLALALAEQPSPRLSDHTRVDYNLDPGGHEQKIQSPADWAKRREAVLEGLQQAMGKLPDRTHLPPLDEKTINKTDGEGFTKSTISFRAEADTDDRIPALLFVPKDLPAGKKIPAILALHPTSPLGKDSIVGVDKNKTYRDYGIDLAKRGYVVLCPDYPSFGDYKNYDFAGARQSGRYLTGTMKGIANHMRCVDFLQSLPAVDGSRIGVIGHSLGGHNSIFVAVFDQRIAAIVSSCGWTPFADYYNGNIKGWTSDRYMPTLRDAYHLDVKQVPFDFPELIAALAPRPFFSNSPLHDANFDVEGVRKGIAAAKPIYALLGAPEALQVQYPDCKHDFPPYVRAEAYHFLDKALKFEPKIDLSERIPDLKDDLPRVAPHEPADAVKTFSTLNGFHMELVASEPLVKSPVACDWDENGRLFVCEMLDYPEANPEDPVGRLTVLEDTTGSGHYDKSTVFAEKLPWVTGVCCYDGGVFVASAPDILYLKDTKGTGHADVRKVVFAGFNRNNVQGLLNCLRWGLDNRIHGATSASGGIVRRPDQPEGTGLSLRGRDFSFDPKLLDLRPESGGAQHGMCFDDFGRTFVTSNSDHVQLVMFDDRYLARNPYLTAASPRVSIALDGPAAEVYRTSPVEAWRVVRTRLRVTGLAPGMIEGGGRAAGYFSGATGVTVYRGDAWPAEYRGQAFIGDVGSNLMHRKVLEQDGVSLKARRVDENREFVSSSDIWFRPSQFANAPDGTMWILDTYREVIEHPASLPPMIKKYLDLRSGWDRGRLWRVAPEGFKLRPTPKLGNATSEELVALLEHPNGWHRDTASRLLFERQDKSFSLELCKIAAGSKLPAARVHALHALAGLNELKSAVLHRGLTDADARVREHSVKLAEALAQKDAAVAADLLALQNDPDILVRYQLAFSLGELTPSEKVFDALANILRKDAGDQWIRLAVFSSLRGGAGDFIVRLAGDKDFLAAPAAGDIFLQLAKQVGARGDAEQLKQVVGVIEALPADRQPIARAIMNGVSSAGPHFVLNPNGKAAQLLQQILANAREQAGNHKLAVETRAAAVRTLALGEFSDVGPLLKEALSAKESGTVQRAAVAALDRFHEPEVGAILLEAWPRLTPRVRQAAADAIWSRNDRLMLLLNAADAGKIPLSDLDPSRLKVATASEDATLRERATALQSKSKLGRRKDVIDAYRESLTMKGEPTRGKAIFQKTCVACHRLENVGNDIGPNLVSMQARGAEAMLINILDPNLEVNPQYIEYVVLTRDGRMLNGLLSAETATSITLKRAQNEMDTVLRSDIAKMKSTGLSLMPEGLEQQFDKQGAADLVSYLMSVK